MAALNSVYLIGRICGRDPLYLVSKKGKPMLHFELVVQRGPDDPPKGGLPDHHHVVVQGSLAEALQPRLRRGSEVLVTGLLQSRDIQREINGKLTNARATEVLARRVEFLDRSTVNWPEAATSVDQAPGGDGDGAEEEKKALVFAGGVGGRERDHAVPGDGP